MREAALSHPLPANRFIEQVFWRCFGDQYHTVLQGEATEPFYQAAHDQQPARIFYRNDYAQSALHEVAHWCVAGAKRRTQDDYGYWYAADGRDLAQQREFEKVEVKPQALEFIFTASCGWDFRVSVDNLALPEYDASDFAQAVKQQACAYWAAGLPQRAAQFRAALQATFNPNQPFTQVYLLTKFCA